MQIKLILQSTVASCLLTTAVYADKPEKEIVGKWADAGGENIEYKADGTFTETPVSGDVIKGKFSFPDATHIKVELEGPLTAAGPIIFPVTVKGDAMDVTAIDGSSVARYKRTK